MASDLNPGPRTNIAAMLEANAARFAERVAVIDGAQQVTYGELHGRARRLGRALLASGLQPGELVVIWAPNVLRWVEVAHAVWLAGGVVLPLNTRLKALETGPILERTQARFLFTVGEVAGLKPIEMLRAAYGAAEGDRPFQRLPHLETLVRIDDPAGFEAFAARSETVADTALTGASRDGGELAEILFTSGTTGNPKGVQLGHAQLLRSFHDWAELAGLREGDVYLVIPPFSHGFGLNGGIVVAAARGMSMVLINIFDPDLALDLIERHRVNVLAGPPNLYASLIDRKLVRGAETASLRVAFVGAANVPVELLRRVRAELGFQRAINSYGLIEGCVVSMTRADDPEDVISTTTGRALDGVSIRVVDDDGADVPVGQPGEIWLHGFNVMRGYWNDPAQTRAALGDDGWLRTGDLGSLDAAGNLRIIDRKKDMFVTNGFNVYPAEVENLLLKTGMLSAVSVVGVADRKRGEVGYAYAVPLPGQQPTEDQVIAWAKANIANYKVPRLVFLRDALPLNPNGKVDKELLRRQASEHAAEELMLSEK